MATSFPLVKLQTSLCSYCGVLPKYHDGVREHNYCSKTCATSHRAEICNVCKTQPRFFDGQTLHPFCSRTCATKGVSLVYHGKNKLTGNHPCLKCGEARAHGPFCSPTCSDLAIAAAPMLLPVPPQHPIFQSVENQFKVSWKNNKPPQVRHIYKVIVNQALLDRYEAYRDKVEKEGNFTKIGRATGNENRRWHGTTRKCTLGDNGNTKFCGNLTCPLCNIMVASFDTARAAAGMFGYGIYSSATSSKSNGFSRNAVVTKYKAMFLTKVVVGKVSKMTAASYGLRAPPAGTHSIVYNMPGRDELIVYDNDAIRPSYLLIYDAV